jgi:hypothetical protein
MMIPDPWLGDTAGLREAGSLLASQKEINMDAGVSKPADGKLQYPARRRVAQAARSF